MSLNQILRELHEAFPDSDQRMPALFVGHGSPMNAIENNEFSLGWAAMGNRLPKPRAILCISAHWQTRGTRITGMDRPRTIHDFGGFPQALFDVQYSVPGSPTLAQLAREAIQTTEVCLDDTWGLDHGSWSVLARMFPNASIPVVQLSLDRTQGAAYHYALGKELRSLRNKGVLIIGSGNIVHGLQDFSIKDIAFDWALEFDETVKRLIEDGDHSSLIHYQKLGRSVRRSVPTNEHYLPLLYTLALQDRREQVRFFNDKVTFGSISMRSVWLA